MDEHAGDARGDDRSFRTTSRANGDERTTAGCDGEGRTNEGIGEAGDGKRATATESQRKTSSEDASMDSSIDSWFACGMNEEDDVVGAFVSAAIETETLAVKDEVDDPLASLLEMSHEETAFLLDGDGASISAALDAVAKELKAASAHDVAAKAHAQTKETFTIKPSPLGNGVPALQAHAAPPPPGMVAMHASMPILAPPVKYAAYYTGGLPLRMLSNERQAQLDRYRAKRERRLAGIKNKVRYECRKTLADARPRVGGRFIKLSADEKKIKSVHSCPDLSVLAEMQSDIDMHAAAGDLMRKAAASRQMSSDDDSVAGTRTKRLSGEAARSRVSTSEIFSRPSSSEVSTEDEVDFAHVQSSAHYEGVAVSSVMRGSSMRASDLRHCQSEICLAALVGT